MPAASPPMTTSRSVTYHFVPASVEVPCMHRRPSRPRMLGSMLSGLRNARGGPSFRVRVLALLLVVGLIAVVAPVAIALVQWLFDALAAFLF